MTQKSKLPALRARTYHKALLGGEVMGSMDLEEIMGFLRHTLFRYKDTIAVKAFPNRILLLV